MSALAQVLLLSHAGLTAFRLGAGRVCEAVQFDDTEAGRQAFMHHMANAPIVPTGLLVDRADEEYRIATVPHVLRHRAELLARHGARLFGDTPFRHAQVIGRESQGRRDDRVVFSALSRPDAIQPWLRCMHEVRIPLMAIQSAATMSAQLLPVLRARGVVLLAVADAHGLRQSLFDDGTLLFSRRVMFTEHDVVSKARTLREELTRTSHYLRRQAFVTGERIIAMHVVADETLAQQLGDETGLHVTPLPVVATTLDCSPHAQHDLDVLMAELMARKPARGYARPEDRRHYLHWRRRRGIAAACWAGAAAAACAAAYDAGLALGSHETARLIRAGTAQLEMLAADDARIAEATRMRAEVEAADHLLMARQSHRVLLARAGTVLAGFPEIALDTLTLVQPTLADAPVELSLHGRMTGATARFDAFVHALRTLPGHPEVHVVSPPQAETTTFELTLTVATP